MRCHCAEKRFCDAGLLEGERRPRGKLFTKFFTVYIYTLEGTQGWFHKVFWIAREEVHRAQMVFFVLGHILTRYIFD